METAVAAGSGSPSLLVDVGSLPGLEWEAADGIAAIFCEVYHAAWDLFDVRADSVGVGYCSIYLLVSCSDLFSL